MSKATWEDEDLEWKNNLMKEVKTLQDMVGTLMGGGFETPKTEPKPKPRQRQTKESTAVNVEIVESVFQETKKKGIYWCYADQNLSLAEAIADSEEGRYKLGDYTYWTYGDKGDHGYPKCIGRKKL